MRAGLDRGLYLEVILAMRCLEAGQSIATRLAKLQSVLEMQRQLSRLSGRSEQIERRVGISREEFLERYYAANRPVILTDLRGTDSPVLRWSPAHLRERFGHQRIEIMTGRDADPEFELHSERHRSEVLFAEFLESLVSMRGNDRYLVANNHFLEKLDDQELLDDLAVLPAYLDAAKVKGCAFLWVGPAGTLTPLHHDELNGLLLQLWGRKRFRLISPEQTHLLSNDVGVYSPVDCDQPDFAAHPLFREVQMIDLVLEPGEALFVPVGWWHHVRALEASVMLTFTNFVFANRFTWKNPNPAAFALTRSGARWP
jgi:hypothetical protein